jgi:preprotein translocase subunit SecE
MIQSPTPLTFVKESLTELKKVVWPTKQQVIKLTLIVIFVSLATGIFIGGFDYLFTNLFGLLLK